MSTAKMSRATYVALYYDVFTSHCYKIDHLCRLSFTSHCTVIPPLVTFLSHAYDVALYSNDVYIA